ncbi:MAG: DNA helicase II [Gammaproteobacteria bacterium]|nr:DNA helicase II [Gammaproteobacteria bacterium]
MTESLLTSLNDAQRAAVTAPLGNQLILAGAGSGKTRVLTARIAWLVQEMHLSPMSILAVTFTNKAANEMRERVVDLLGPVARAMWIGTFHGIAHRLLRMHWREANLPEHFQILDADDQQRLLRRVIQSLGLDEERWPPKQAQWFINGKKDEGLLPEHLSAHGDVNARNFIRIYQAYEETCARSGLVDFAGLLQKVHAMWLSNRELLKEYQDRFRYILVDEFQDTNAIQYAWIRLLAGGNSHVMIVGDDDQSIYGWRGAKIENILRFNDDFADCQTVRLEQNYRSTGHILAAANALIAKNPSRMGKNLWTSGSDGQPIIVYAGFNDLDEARFIANRIRECQQQGFSLSDVALLYRSNAQSRVLEETLLQSGIPYRVYGGLRFFERAEIRDALGYLRLTSSRDDDPAFERVINTPARGLGERTLEILRETAREHSISLWKAATLSLEKNLFTARAANALTQFQQLIETLATDILNLPLEEQVEHVIHNSGLIEHFRKEKGEKGQTRIDNLEELVNAAREFNPDNQLPDMPPISAFIACSALEAGETAAGAYEDAVRLMTLHSAKGLEFPIVFLCGCEDGLFPHHMTKDDPKGLEEERRLCYVGMTRAMQQLYMTWAESRRLHGREVYHRPSRFLRDIPEKHLHQVRMTARITRPEKKSSWTTPKMPEGYLRIGQQVTHKKFGAGIVLQCEGLGEHARVQVKFEREGTKWLIASFVEA